MTCGGKVVIEVQLTSHSFVSAQIDGAGSSALHGHLDPAGRPVCGGEPGVRCDQNRVKRLCQRDIHRVPSANAVAKLPRARQQQPVAETLTRPCLEVLNRLVSRGLIEPSELVLASDRAEYLYVDDVWRRVVVVEREALSDRLGEHRAGQSLKQAGRVNDQHRARIHDARRARLGPRLDRSDSSADASAQASWPSRAAQRSAPPRS